MISEKMFIGKILFLICLLAIKKTTTESVFQGIRSDNDILIHKSVHEKEPSFIRTSDVAFPKYYEEKDCLITAISVIDNLNNGAEADIDYGGVGHTFANIHLRSAFWNGFNFTIVIYGIKLH